ncbi:DUF2190 domain-containing protein [candidate division KSB1 bacterium]|nr:DUF2190 domain-containing protein [candidate division KSB1 bacterium]
MHTPTLIKSFPVDAACAPFRVLAIGSGSGALKQATGPGDTLLAVADSLGSNAVNRVDAILDGVAQVEYGGAVAQGDYLTSDLNGKAVAATRHTHAENTAAAYTQNAATAAGEKSAVIGVALVSGVAGDIGSAKLNPALI